MKSLLLGLLSLFTASVAIHAAQTASQGIEWDDNSDNETGFTVELAPAAPSTAFSVVGTVGANITAYTLTGLTLETGYQVRIRAFNQKTVSGYSNTVAFTTPVTPINAPVLRLGAAKIVGVNLKPNEQILLVNGPVKKNGSIHVAAADIKRVLDNTSYVVSNAGPEYTLNGKPAANTR